MKTSYNEACARDCSTLEKDLALCEKAGFDYIEIRLDLLRGWLKEHTVEQLKEFFEMHRLKPHAINAVYLHPGMLPDETPDRDDPALQDFKLACEVGSAIGSGYVIIVPPLDPSGVFTGDVAAAEQECIRILKKLSALARPYGMKLCFELVGLRKSCVRSIEAAPISRNLTSVILLAPGTTGGDSAFGNLASVGGSSSNVPSNATPNRMSSRSGGR